MAKTISISEFFSSSRRGAKAVVMIYIVTFSGNFKPKWLFAILSHFQPQDVCKGGWKRGEANKIQIQNTNTSIRFRSKIQIPQKDSDSNGKYKYSEEQPVKADNLCYWPGGELCGDMQS